MLNWLPMTVLATDCTVAIRCINPTSEYGITPQPVVPGWLASATVLGLLILAFALSILRRRV